MRDWWLRTLLVLQRAAARVRRAARRLAEAAADRAEPVLLIVLLAGIASVLSTRPPGT